MIRSIYFVNFSGEILIEKHYRNKVNRSDLEPILKNLDKPDFPPPILDAFGTIFLIEKENDIFIIAACDPEGSQMFSSSLLIYIRSSIENTLRSKITESIVKTDFATIYQVLDQLIDAGFPFFTETNAFIGSTLPNQLQIPIDPQYPWRGTYAPKGAEDIEIEIVETIQSRINSSGKSDILLVNGEIHVHSNISGTPIVHLSLNLPHKLDDYTFHRCVDINQYLSRQFNFTPPEGDFILMTYITRLSLSTLPVFLHPSFVWSPHSVVFKIALRIDPQIHTKQISDISVSFALPNGIAIPALAASVGAIYFDTKTKIIKWKVDISKKQDNLFLTGSASVDDGFVAERASISVDASFIVHGSTSSGCKIEGFDISGIPKVSTSIKYTTKSGIYTFSPVN